MLIANIHNIQIISFRIHIHLNVINLTGGFSNFSIHPRNTYLNVELVYLNICCHAATPPGGRSGTFCSMSSKTASLTLSPRCQVTSHRPSWSSCESVGTLRSPKKKRLFEIRDESIFESAFFGGKVPNRSFHVFSISTVPVLNLPLFDPVRLHL